VAGGATGCALPLATLGADWYGYGGVGNSHLSHGNTPELVSTAHQIRSGLFNKAPTDIRSIEEYYLVIVGCGIKASLEGVLKMPAECSAAADLFLASAAGLGSDAISAYVAYQLPMPGLSDVPPEPLRRHSFPDGNSGYARYFLKSLLPDAIEGDNSFADIITGRINLPALDRPGEALQMILNATVFSIRHRDEHHDAVDLLYRKDEQNHAIRAKAVIMPTGGWINRYVVKDMPQAYMRAYSAFQHAAFLVANVALASWRFMEKLGISGAIWEGGEMGFGYSCNLRRPMQVGRHKPALAIRSKPAGPISMHRPHQDAVLKLGKTKIQRLKEMGKLWMHGVTHIRRQ
jgi:hypothetical protein